MPRQEGIAALADLYGPAGKAVTGFKQTYNAVYKCRGCGVEAGRPDNVGRKCTCGSTDYNDVVVIRTDPITGQVRTCSAVDWVHFMLAWNGQPSPSHLVGYGNEQAMRRAGTAAGAGTTTATTQVVAPAAPAGSSTANPAGPTAAAPSPAPSTSAALDFSMRGFDREMERALRLGHQVVARTGGHELVEVIMRDLTTTYLSLGLNIETSSTGTAAATTTTTASSASPYTGRIRAEIAGLVNDITLFDQHFERALQIGANLVEQQGYTQDNIRNLTRDVVRANPGPLQLELEAPDSDGDDES